jgi:hypothetical protein
VAQTAPPPGAPRHPAPDSGSGSVWAACGAMFAGVLLLGHRVLGILKDAGWAPALGVALAGLGVVAGFIRLPYQPIRALVPVAVAVFVIWALCTDSTNPAGRP